MKRQWEDKPDWTMDIVKKITMLCSSCKIKRRWEDADQGLRQHNSVVFDTANYSIITCPFIFLFNGANYCVYSFVLCVTLGLDARGEDGRSHGG